MYPRAFKMALKNYSQPTELTLELILFTIRILQDLPNRLQQAPAWKMSYTSVSIRLHVHAFSKGNVLIAVS